MSRIQSIVMSSLLLGCGLLMSAMIVSMLSSINDRGEWVFLITFLVICWIWIMGAVKALLSGAD